MKSLDGIVTLFQDGVRMTIRAKPGVARARAMRIVDIGDGKRAIEISVAEAAQEGKANRGIIERLAREIGVPRKNIMLKAGDTGRIKIVEITGDAVKLAQKLAEKLKS